MRWLTGILLCVALTMTSRAASIEARLIRASNDSANSDEQLKNLEPKLKKIFGYQGYKQLGVQQVAFKEKEPHRLDLGEGYVIFVTPKEADKKGRVMDFEMYSGRAALVKSTVCVAPKRELFIKGPEVGSTLVIVSLAVVE